MNIGWVKPPEKIKAGTQMKNTRIDRKNRPNSRIDSGGRNKAKT
jgi:hypothetical protein